VTATTTVGVAGGLVRLVRADRRTVLRWTVAVIVAAVVVRVGWAAWIAHAEPEAVRTPDTPGYLEPARALIETSRFSLSPEDATPMYVRTPGYPVFLVPILWLTGSEWAISPIQAVVSLLAVAATALVGWRLFGKTAGAARRRGGRSGPAAVPLRGHDHDREPGDGRPHGDRRRRRDGVRPAQA
jgi:4-amino-4-deoxy-L-arabinose transferase-like glycosyltransferase